MSFKIKGLNDLANKIDSISKNAEKLSGTHQVPLKELFNSEFIVSHTNGQFSSFKDFIYAKFGDLSFEEIPEDELDKWVISATDFNSWKSMQESAMAKYVKKQLGF